MMNLLLEIDFPAIDPIALDLGIQVRWYGLGYLLSFLCAWVMLGRMQRSGYLSMKPDDVSGMIMWCIAGTFIGGRLGYLVFYDPNFWSGHYFKHPGEIIGIGSDGFKGVAGLSFHGGLIGVMTAGGIFFYRVLMRDMRDAGKAATAALQSAFEGGEAQKSKRFVARFCEGFDAGSIVAALGIFIVRCMNFINGELYGRPITDEAGKYVTDAEQAPAWAMRFPTCEVPLDPGVMTGLNPDLGGDGGGRLELVRELVSQGVPSADIQRIISRFGNASDSDQALYSKAWEAVRDNVVLRHPSQIYQALCEGLAVFIVLLMLRSRFERRGMIGACFLMAYGVGRWFMELFRQPDKQFSEGGMEGWGNTVLKFLHMTQGQLLCVGMILAGVALAVYVKRSSNPFLPRTPIYTGAQKP